MEQTLLWITAIGAILTAVGTIGLVVVAWLTLGGAGAQLRLLREQAERDGRPYVFVEVAPGFHGIGYWDLVIRNTGRTTAHNVTIQVPNLKSRGADDYIHGPLSRYLSKPRTIVPGGRHRVMWSATEGNGRSPAGAPDFTTCIVKFGDEAGRAYEESYPISIREVAEAAPAPNVGSTTKSSSPADLANIERALRALNIHVAELRR